MGFEMRACFIHLELIHCKWYMPLEVSKHAHFVGQLFPVPTTCTLIFQKAVQSNAENCSHQIIKAVCRKEKLTSHFLKGESLDGLTANVEVPVIIVLEDSGFKLTGRVNTLIFGGNTQKRMAIGTFTRNSSECF